MLQTQTESLLQSLGVQLAQHAGNALRASTPIDGSVLTTLKVCSAQEQEAALQTATQAFSAWRAVPAPQRGELVRVLGDVLRAHKENLGRLVSIESGKILQEGLGEVQEMIDICDYAVGLSRQLYGLTISSERPMHRLQETWHPLGPVLVITAFNFPVAVWAWNAALALVCGNSVLWKPSEKTPLTALAVQALFEQAAQRCAAGGLKVPVGLSQMLVGERALGQSLVMDARVALVSATGSCAMGRAVNTTVAQRFGKVLLELGGNNAAIVAPSADLNLVLRGVLFAAVGTAGQRCTTLRRLIVHTSVLDEVLAGLTKAYASVRIGNPLAGGTLVGPLIDETAYTHMQQALAQAQQEGGQVVCGGVRVQVAGQGAGEGVYVQPAIVRMPSQSAVMLRETFAPILYVLAYEKFEDAIALNNAVPQGLSSSVFSNDLRETELFLSAQGSDCGIANVNIGTSGAEIGGAFGGEKETGGGRESGSDAWRAYMRRATNTINYGRDLPLAQGIQFGS
jgi:aldehyde dehydrogenase (NAD+)